MELQYYPVAKVEELPPGSTKRVRPTKGEYLLVCNVEGEIYAIEDFCTHDGSILGFGDLDGKFIECPRHFAKFDVTCGVATGFWKHLKPVPTFPVRITNDDIEVGIQVR